MGQNGKHIKRLESPDERKTLEGVQPEKCWTHHFGPSWLASGDGGPHDSFFENGVVLFTFSGQTACVTMYYNVVRRVGLGGLTVLLLRSELLMLKHKMFCNSKINPHGRTRKGGVGKHNRAPKGQRKLVECDSRLNGTGILSVLSLRLYVGFLTCVALCCAFSVFPN